MSILSLFGQPREKAALQSYERHVKKEGDVEVKLFQFSESDESDVDKLTQELDGMLRPSKCGCCCSRPENEAICGWTQSTIHGM